MMLGWILAHAHTGNFDREKAFAKLNRDRERLIES